MVVSWHPCLPGFPLRSPIYNLVAAFCVLFGGLASVPLPATAASPDETARILAGLVPAPARPGAPAEPLPGDYARAASGAWRDYERRMGEPMRDWARAELEYAPGETVFYPFSGPDFPTVQQLYPDAGRYVLVAIQPAGPPPALERYTAAERAAYLAGFLKAWKQFSHIGFFRTDDLEADAKQKALRTGVTAPLLAFAARLGYRVAAVAPMRISADGTALEANPAHRADDPAWESVRLRLEQGGREVLLDYVRLDISDRGLRENRAGAAWVERMAGHRTLFKAASHLPQRPHYSILRDAVVRRAPSIWQDETGIDHYLLSGRFAITLYGQFSKPHRLFQPDSQSALAAAYRSAQHVRPLPFKVGYEKAYGSSVQVAVRRQTTVIAGRPESRPPVQPALAAAPEREVRALQLRIGREIANYTRRPRKLFLGGAPDEPVHAGYVASVKSRLARLLREAGVGPGKGPVVSLTLASDGSLRAAELERSSGNSARDARIQSLVGTAAPFPHWPDALRSGVDLLVITLHLSAR